MAPSERSDSRRSGVSALVGVIALTSAAGCGTQQLRSYDGPPRLPTEVATIKSNSILVVRVDGKRVDGGPFDDETDPIEGSRRQALEVLPGRHRITVRYYSDGVFGVNQFSMSHTFEAGKVYTFRAIEQSLGLRTIWLPQLIEDKTQKVVAIAETQQDRVPARSAPGTATLRGIAIAIEETATGQPVILVKRNKATDDWVKACRRWAQGSDFVMQTFDISPRDVPERKAPVAVTVGYGLGFFEFKDVPPGDYYIVFRGGGKRFGDLALTVKPGETLREGLEVPQRLEDGSMATSGASRFGPSPPPLPPPPRR